MANINQSPLNQPSVSVNNAFNISLSETEGLVRSFEYISESVSVIFNFNITFQETSNKISRKYEEESVPYSIFWELFDYKNTFPRLGQVFPLGDRPPVE